MPRNHGGFAAHRGASSARTAIGTLPILCLLGNFQQLFMSIADKERHAAEQNTPPIRSTQNGLVVHARSSMPRLRFVANAPHTMCRCIWVHGSLVETYHPPADDGR